MADGTGRRCKCGVEIGAARLEALPHTKTCVACSTERPLRGVMSWEHKTAPTIEILNETQFLEHQRLTRHGVSAQLPFESKASSGFTTEQYPDPYEGEIQRLRKARCHPDADAVTPDGLCAACAVNWYESHGRRHIVNRA